MLITSILLAPMVILIIKLVLYFVVNKYGKISYDGFSAAGFAYSSKKDIFYSTKIAWQRNFGYTHKYDVMAPLFQMIMDTEPIRFNYNNKNWLITFWKGQYGIVTGAEIGIYCTKELKVNKKTVYFPVTDNEILDMELVLYKNNEIITKVKACHWWLAVFKLGMFSKPKELRMDVRLHFPNNEMLEAFLKAFKKLKHKKKYYNVINNTFIFKYIKPRTRKIWTRNWLSDLIRQRINRKNVELYNKLLNDLIDNNGIDDSNKTNDLIIVDKFIPKILKNSFENNKKDVAEKLYNDNNVLLFDSNIYSEVRSKNS